MLSPRYLYARGDIPLSLDAAPASRNSLAYPVRYVVAFSTRSSMVSGSLAATRRASLTPKSLPANEKGPISFPRTGMAMRHGDERLVSPKRMPAARGAVCELRGNDDRFTLEGNCDKPEILTQICTFLQGHRFGHGLVSDIGHADTDRVNLLGI